MDDKPLRNPAVVWREEPSGRARIEAGSPSGETPCLTLVHLGTMFQLNLVGAEIWKRCDGTMTREEIVEAILPSMEVEPEVLARDVAAFLEEMRSRGWLR